ncbi:MAG: hypothetical protein IKT40_07425 [Bacilli bacterium]|nr:hypothetical protein [Bacilli bacterium]
MKKLTNDEFINRSIKIHGDKYDYSKVNYISAHEKVCIICPIHGEFWQKASDHLKGHGCKLCGFEATNAKQKYTTEDFIKKAKLVHGDKYDYSKVEYIDSKHDVIIICPIHGEFKVKANSHLLGNICWKCGVELSRAKNKKTKEQFIDKSKGIHGNKYTYENVDYIDYHTEVLVTCPIHGDFLIKPIKHAQGTGCPYCSESKLEKNVRIILEKNDISHIQEYKCEWLKYKKSLSLDFYLPQYNIAIECQGSQHFGLSSWGTIKKFEFEEIFARDERKRNLCNENDLVLVYYLEEKYNPYVENLGVPYFNSTKDLLEFINSRPKIL